MEKLTVTQTKLSPHIVDQIKLQVLNRALSFLEELSKIRLTVPLIKPCEGLANKSL